MLAICFERPSNAGRPGDRVWHRADASASQVIKASAISGFLGLEEEEMDNLPAL